VHGRGLLDGARKDVDRRSGAGFGRQDRWTFKIALEALLCEEADE
jgi:hypothetical protein